MEVCMNQKHVISLELAKKLKDLGCQQESEFYWSTKGKQAKLWHEMIFPLPNYSAFNANELGDILPKNKIYISKDGDKWCCLLGRNLQEGYGVFADNIQESMGLMLAYLKEKGLV